MCVISVGAGRNSAQVTSKSVLNTETELLSLTDISAFRPHEDTPKEKKDIFIPGEPQSRGEKPLRILNNFTFFLHGREVFAELDDLAHDGYSSVIEAIGDVLAVRGDEMPDENEDADEPSPLHLTAIINASIDYEKYNESVVSLSR